MRSLVRFLALGCLLAGIGLLAYALRTGGAQVYLVLIVPVFSGSSSTFFFAVLLLVAGVFLLPLSFSGAREPPGGEDAPTPAAGRPQQSPGSSGGLVLIGPVPIFFGNWRTNPPISYRWAVVLGAALVIAAVLLLWGVSVL